MHADKVSERTQTEQHRLRCNLPLLPEPHRLETIATLKAAIPARAALATFAQALKQSSITRAALDSFCLMESVGALQLSGRFVELRDALQAPASGQADELSRHNSTRIAAHERLVAEPVSCSLALDLASSLYGSAVSVRRDDLRGAMSSTASSSSAFSNWTPPVGSERIQALLDNWQRFVQQSSGDLDPLVMVAAAHGQWNALQPFIHENIATGQLLSSLLMCEEDLLPAPALPLSLYFSRRATRHWDCLYQAVALGDHAAWVQFYIAGVTEAAMDAVDQLARWEQLKHTLTDVMIANLPKQPSMELIDVCSRPSFGLAELRDAGLDRRQTASAWMQRLVSAGLLSELRVGKEKRYINKAVLQLLTPSSDYA